MLPRSEDGGDSGVFIRLKEDGANGVRIFYRIAAESDGKELPRVRKGCTAASAGVCHVRCGPPRTGRSVNSGHYGLLLT